MPSRYVADRGRTALMTLRTAPPASVDSPNQTGRAGPDRGLQWHPSPARPGRSSRAPKRCRRPSAPAPRSWSFAPTGTRWSSRSRCAASRRSRAGRRGGYGACGSSPNRDPAPPAVVRSRRISSRIRTSATASSGPSRSRVVKMVTSAVSGRNGRRRTSAAVCTPSRGTSVGTAVASSGMTDDALEADRCDYPAGSTTSRARRARG
jgi:hypothetical protein